MNIENLKNNLKNLKQKQNDLYNQYLYIKNQVEIETKNLMNTCQHTNKEKRREECLYGETYFYCPDCELELY
tara:strand:- start:279 stop:494 length:216 start_codon:yes stop_codon:yes gene_type:complete